MNIEVERILENGRRALMNAGKGSPSSFPPKNYGSSMMSWIKEKGEDRVRKAIKDKNCKVDLDQILVLDKDIKTLKRELDGLRALQNLESKRIGLEKRIEKELLKLEAAGVTKEYVLSLKEANETII